MIIMNQHDKFKQPMAMSLMLRTMITDESAQNTKISDILNRHKCHFCNVRTLFIILCDVLIVEVPMF